MAVWLFNNLRFLAIIASGSLLFSILLKFTLDTGMAICSELQAEEWEEAARSFTLHTP